MDTVLTKLQKAGYFRQAREVLNNSGWCQGTLALDAEGNTCVVSSPQAVSYCLMGVIRKVTGNVLIDHKLFNVIGIYLTESGMMYTGSVLNYNDVPGRIKEEIMELLDKLIIKYSVEE